MCLRVYFHGNKDLFSSLNYLNSANIQTSYYLLQMLVFSNKHTFVQLKVVKFRLLMDKKMALKLKKSKKLLNHKFLIN